jgi:TRAP-type C4-dicarboxylate transport system substrate-binding protein
MNLERTAHVALAIGTTLIVIACAGSGGPTPSGASPASPTAVPGTPFAVPGTPGAIPGTPSALPATGSPAPIAAAPVTLRLAVAAGEGSPNTPEVKDFVQQVATLSNGKVTIAPIFAAGGTAYEEGVAAQVARGEAELGLTGLRVWDLAGSTSLRALQTPFLVDNDALALAVARSSIASRALDGMNGVIGLTLWAEDLRHPSAFLACGKDFRSPAGVKGATVLVVPSGVSRALLGALGAKEWPFTGDRGVDAESCTLQGAEASIPNLGILPMGSHPIAVADVTLFPNYMVLTANEESFSRLSDAQRDIIRQAAVAVQTGAFARQASDRTSAKAWCDAGGGIVLAGSGAQDAFRNAAAPVYSELERDPLTKTLIDDIRTLAATITASPGPEPCGPVPPPADVTADDLTGYVGTSLPDGTYRRELIVSELVKAGVSPLVAEKNAGRLTFTFKGGAVTQLVEQRGTAYRCEGTSESVDGKIVRMRTTSGPGPCDFTGELVWRRETDGISFVVWPFEKIAPGDRALLDHWVWTRID